MSTIKEQKTDLPLSLSERVGRFEPFVNQVTELAKSHPGILACALHGSRTQDSRYFSDASDLDLVFIVSSQDSVAEIKAQLQSFPKITLVSDHPDYLGGDPGEYWYYGEKESEVGLKFLTIDQIKQRIMAGYESLEGYEQTVGFWQHVLGETLPLHDPQNLFQNIHEQIYPMNEDLRKAIIEKYLRLLSLRIAGGRPSFKNHFEEMHDIHDIILEIARVHYALNGVHIMKILKQYDIDMQDFTPQISAEIAQLMTIQARNKTDQEEVGRKKRALINAVFQKLLAEYQRLYSEDLLEG